jgi:predicted permease
MYTDIRHTLRSLLQTPGFAAIVILTLGLGIGFNTAIYSVINAFILRPLPVKDPGTLLVLATRDRHTEVPHGLSFADYRDYRGLTSVFSDMIARREFPIAANWKRDNKTGRIWVTAVTTNYFDMLGVGALLGRTFLPQENRAAVAVLDYVCWHERFAADPGVIGRALNIDGRMATVIGVAPESFQGTQVSLRPELYVPLEAPGLNGAANPGRLEQRDAHELRVFGRLKPGATVAQARAAVNVLAAQLARQYPDTNRGVAVLTIPERFARPEPQVSEALPAIAIFSMTIVGLVLLIACANIANLLLVRAVRRGREMALRTAVGASRFRIVRLMLTESVTLGLLGGGAGVAISYWGIRVIRSRPASVDLPVSMDWNPDWRVFLFATGVTLLTGIICGLMPAFAISRPDLAAMLREGGGRTTGRKARLISVLVAGQVGVSMLLLIMASLFIRGGRKAQDSDLGFERQNLQLLSVDLAKQNYDHQRAKAFIRQATDQIEAMPGVRGVSVATYVPFDQQGGEAVFSDEQASTRPSDALSVFRNTVGVDYFRVMGIPVLNGRVFDRHDDETAPRVAVINEALGLRLWPGKNPLQRTIRLVSGGTLQVIGVVKTGKYAFLAEQPRPYLYLPILQNDSAPTVFHIRAAGSPSALISGIRETIRRLDPDLPVFNVKTMEEHLQHGYVFSTIILGGALSGLFGLLGLALASIGLYGVVANTVAQRTREIGIRAALGAGRGSILILVIRNSIALTAIGACIGLVGGIGVGPMLKHILFTIDPVDWRPFVLVLGFLVIVTFVACLVPACKALKVAPVDAIRCD